MGPKRKAQSRTSARTRFPTRSGFAYEHLEERVLLTVNPIVMPNEVFFFGTVANEELFLRVNSTNELEFSQDGSNYSSSFPDPANPGIPARLPILDLTINVELGAGHDRLVLQPSFFEALATNDPQLSINGGTGKDSVVLTSDGELRLEAGQVRASPDFDAATPMIDNFTIENIEAIHVRAAEVKPPLTFDGLVIEDPGNPVWRSQGPGPITEGQIAGIPGTPVTGAIEAIAPHPTDANVVYVGAVGGGIWRTTSARAPVDGVDNDGDGVIDGNINSPAANVLDDQPTWEPLTDQFPSLAITALAFDPSDATSRTIWAGTGSSSSSSIGGKTIGLMKTTDGGDTWSVFPTVLATQGRTVKQVLPTTINQGAGNVILVASEATQFGPGASQLGGGLLRSTDGGNGRFEKISGNRNDGLDNNSNGTIDEPAEDTGLPGGTVTDIIANPANAMQFFAGMPGQGAVGGIYRSDDGGRNWVSTSAGIPAALISNSTRVDLTISGGANNPVYASFIRGGQLAGVFRSTDLGATWTAMTFPSSVDNGVLTGLHAGTSGDRHMSLVAHPTNPNLIYIGGDRQPSLVGNAAGLNDWVGRLFEGNALTGTWTQIVGTGANGTAPHADSRDLVFDSNGDLLEADDGGIYRLTTPATNATRRWHSVIGDLGLAEFYSVAWDADRDLVIGGTQDIGNGLQSTPDSPLWNEVSKGDGGIVHVAEQTGNDRLFYTSQALGTGSSSGGRYFYRDGTSPAIQVNLQVAGTGVASSTLGAFDATTANSHFFVAPYEVNSQDANRVLIGSQFLYEHTLPSSQLTLLNGAPVNIGGGVFRPPAAANVGAVNSMVFGGQEPDGAGGSTSKPNIGWVGTNNNPRLWVRQTDGANDSFVPVVSYPAAAGNVIDIAVDPFDWRRVYVLDQAGQVWFSANGGADPSVAPGAWGWTKLTANLPTLPGAARLRTIEVVRKPGATPSVVLVGGEGGVFRLIQSDFFVVGTPWNEFGGGLPETLVTDITYNPTDDVLLVGTLGRGAWTVHDASLFLDRSAELTIKGTTGNDSFHVERVANKPWLLQLSHGENIQGVSPVLEPVAQFAVSGIERLSFSGGLGDDHLAINHRGGAVAGVVGADFIAFDGGPGTNSATVDGNGRKATFTRAKPNEVQVETRDPFGQKSTQILRTSNIVAPTINLEAPAKDVAAVAKGIKAAALDLGRAMPFAIGNNENVPLLDIHTISRVLNGQRTVTPRAKDDPFSAVAQVNPGSPAQLEGGTSFLARIIEEGLGAFDLDDTGPGGAIQDFESLRQALDDLDDMANNVTLDQVTDQDGDGEADVTFAMSVTKPLTGIADLHLSAAPFGSFGQIALDGALEIATTIELNLTMGIDGLGFFVRPNPNNEPELTLRDISISGEATASGSLGFLGVEMTDSMLQLDPDAAITFKLSDPGHDELDGFIRPPELAPTDLAELFDMQVSGNAMDGLLNDLVFDASFDIASIADGVDVSHNLNEAALQLAWADLASPLSPTITATNTEGQDLIDFVDLSPAEVLDAVGNVAARFEDLFDPLLNVELPFDSTADDGTTLKLGDIVDVAQGFQSSFVDLLQVAPALSLPQPRFETVQEVATLLINGLGIDTSLTEVVSYDSSSGLLTFTVPLRHTFTPISRELDLLSADGLPISVDPIAVDLTTTMGADVSFGFDLDAATTAPLDSFFFNISEVNANITARATEIGVHGELGLMEFSVSDGALVFDATVNLPITDPTPNTSMSLDDLQTIASDVIANPTNPEFVNLVLETKVLAAAGNVNAFLGTSTEMGEPETGVLLDNGKFAFGFFHTLDLNQVIDGNPSDGITIADMAAPTFAFDVSADAGLIGLEDVLTVNGSARVRFNGTGDAVSQACIGGTIFNGGCEGGAGDLEFAAAEADAQSVIISGDIALSEFVSLSGQLELDLREEIVTTTPVDGSPPVEVSVLKMGASQIHGFVGAGGPYWTDSNLDGKIDSADQPSSDATGVALTEMTIGLALMTPTNANDRRRYYALKSVADSLTLVGLDGVSATANALSVDVNGGINSDGTSTPAIDLSSSSLTVPTGEAASLTLDYGTDLLSISSMVSANVGPASVAGDLSARIQDGAMTLEVRDLTSDIAGFNVADILPIEIERLRVEFPDAQDLSSVTIATDGRFLLDQGPLAELPFTPIIHIGNPDGIGSGEVQSVSTADNGSFALEIAIDCVDMFQPGTCTIEPVNFGPITLGFDGFDLQATGTANSGDASTPSNVDESVIVSGLITLGGYQNGQFVGDVSGLATIDSGSFGMVEVDLNGFIDLAPNGSTTLSATGTATANASLGNANLGVSVDGAEVTFGFSVTATPQPAPQFVDLQVSGQIDSLSVDQFVVEVGEMMILTADGVDIDFNAPNNQKIATLDGVSVEFPALPLFAGGTINGVDIYSDRIEIAAANLNVDGVIGSNPRLLNLDDATIGITNIGFNFETRQLVPVTGETEIGAVTFTADSATLMPDFNDSAGLATVRDFTGALDFRGNISVSVGCDADMETCDANEPPGLDANVGSLLAVQASHGEINIGPDFDVTVPLFDVERANLSLPSLFPGASLTLEDLQLSREGQFTISRGSFDAQGPDDLFDTIGIGEFLPFGVRTVAVESLDGGPISLDEFDLRFVGDFNFDMLTGDFVDPFVRMGEQSDPNLDSFDVTFRYANGQIAIQDTGPIALGFRGFEIGEMVLEGEIELGGYVDGEFQPEIGGRIRLDENNPNQMVRPPASEDPLPEDLPDDFQGELGSPISFDGFEVELAGTFIPADQNNGTTSISIDGSSDVKLRFKVGELLELYGVNFAFHVDITNPADAFAPEIEPRLDNLGVDYLKVAIPDLFAVTATNATINFTRPNPDIDPLAEIERVGIEFPDLAGIGGELDFGEEGLKILPGGLPDFAALQGFDVAFDASSGNLVDQAFQFLPVEMERLAVNFKTPDPNADPPTLGFVPLIQQIHSQGLPANTTQLTTLIDQLTSEMTLVFSGGLSSIEVGDSTIWPFTATLDDIELDIAKLKGCFESFDTCEFPVESLDGFEIALDPIELVDGFVLAGGLQIGSTEIMVDGSIEDVLYGRIFGEFTFNNIGANAQLVISEYGPVAASFGVPLAIVLGQTGILITGVEGTLQFGRTLPSISEPEELTGDEFQNPLDINFGDEEVIREFLTPAVRNQRYTWQDAFTVALAGKVSHVAVAGAISGRVTLGANVGLRGPDSGLKFIGFGDVNVIGMPIAEARLLFDLSDPINPVLAATFQAPAPGNPLSFLIPVRLDLGALLDTKGMALAVAVGTRAFIAELATGTLQIGAELFDDALQELAAKLTRQPFSPLARMLRPNPRALLDIRGGAGSSDNDLRIQARYAPSVGRPIRIRLLTSDENQPASVAVRGQDITVQLETSNGEIQTTAAALRELVNNHPQASSLVDVTGLTAVDGGDFVAGSGIVSPTPGFLSLMIPLFTPQEITDQVLAAIPQDLGQLDEALDTAIELAGAFTADFLVAAGESLETRRREAANEEQLRLQTGLSASDIDGIFEIPEFLVVQFEELDSVARDSMFAFTGVIKDAAIAAISELGDVIENDDLFDPRFVMRGALQPVLLGIPLGSPTFQTELSLSKRGLFFGTEFSIEDTGRKLAAASSGPFGVVQALIPPWIKDRIFAAVRLPFDSNAAGNAADAMIDLLEGNLPLDKINLLSTDWLVQLKGAIDVFGYELASLNGILFPANDVETFGDRIQLVFEPTADYPNAVANTPESVNCGPDDNGCTPFVLDPSRIQVTDPAFADSILDRGGLLLQGSLQIPSLLQDPLGFISSNPTVESLLTDPSGTFDFSDPAGAFGNFQTLMANLGEVSEMARVTMFIPSLTSIVEQGLNLENSNVTFPGEVPASVAITDAQIVLPNDELNVENVVVDANRFVVPNHGLRTGSPLVFRTNINAPTGILDDQLVYVTEPRGDSFAVAETWDDALAAREIELTDSGGGSHFFSVSSHVLLPNHKFDTGDRVTVTAAGGTLPLPLVEGQEYYITDTEPGSFALATATYAASGAEIIFEQQQPSGIDFQLLPAAKPLLDLSGAQQELSALFDEFFFDGVVDNTILGFDLGQSRIRGTSDGVSISGTIPWLGDLQASFELRSVETLPNGVGTEGTLQRAPQDPLSASDFEALDGFFFDATNTFESLHANVALPFPTMCAAVAIGNSDVADSHCGGAAPTATTQASWADVLDDVVGFDVSNIFELPIDAGAQLRAFSPGFDVMSADVLQARGGIELSGDIEIEHLMSEPATFVFQMTPPEAGLLPDFSASAAVPNLSIPGLSGAGLEDLFRFENVTLELAQANGELSLGFSANAHLLGDVLTASTQGDFVLGPDGFVGAADLTVSGASPDDPTLIQLAPNVSLMGDLQLLVNSTSQPQQVLGFTLPRTSGRLAVSGVLNVDGFEVAGTFEMEVAPGGVRVLASGDLDLDGFVDLDALGFLQLDADGGVGVHIELSREDSVPDFGSLAFNVGGSFVLQANTTNSQIVVPLPANVDLPFTDGNELTIPARPNAALFRVLVNGHVNVLGFELAGAFGMELTNSLSIPLSATSSESLEIDLGPLGSIRTSGGILLSNDSGIHLAADTTLAANDLGLPGLIELNGEVAFSANTSSIARTISPGLQVAAGPYAELHVSDASIELLNFLTLTGSADLVANPTGFSFHADMGLDLGPLGAVDAVQANVRVLNPANDEPRVEGRFSAVGVDLTLNRFGCLYGTLFGVPLPAFAIGVGSCDRHVILDDTEFLEPDGNGLTTLDGNRTEQLVARITPPGDALTIINYRFSDDSAVAGADYQASNGTVKVLPNEEYSEPIIVTMIGDNEEEVPREDFFVQLTRASFDPGSCGPFGCPQEPVTNPLPRATITILDDDAPLGPDVDVVIGPGTGMAIVAGEEKSNYSAEIAEGQGIAFDVVAPRLIAGDAVTIQYTVVPQAGSLRRIGANDLLPAEFPTGEVIVSSGARDTLIIDLDPRFYEMHERVDVRFEVAQPAALAKSTTLLTKQVALTILNDDRERPENAVLFYNFDYNEREFNDATLIAEAKANTDGAKLYEFDKGPTYTASGITASRFDHRRGIGVEAPGLDKVDPQFPTAGTTPAIAATAWESTGPAGSNLVANSGNEIPGFAGWTQARGKWGGTTGNGPKPLAGAQYFSAGDFAANDRGQNQLFQDVLVKDFASAIDAGAQKFVASTIIHSLDEKSPDLAQLRLDYLDDSGDRIDSLSSRQISSPNNWERITLEAIVPARTRVIRVFLNAINGDPSETNGVLNTYFDDVAVQMIARGEPEYYEFDLIFEDDPDTSEVDALTITGIDFWDLVAESGPGSWELETEFQGKPQTVGAGPTHTNEFGHTIASPIQGLTCIVPSGDPITFRLYGIDYTDANKEWRIENFAVLGQVHSAESCKNPPIAQDDSATVDAGTAVSIPVLDNDNDFDGDELSVLSYTQPINGTAIATGDGAISYVPDVNFVGTDKFVYTVTDGFGGTSQAAVSVTVQLPVLTNPKDDFAMTTEGTRVAIPVLENDSDEPSSLHIIGYSLPRNGSAVANRSGTFLYSPNPGFLGTDQFSYSFADTRGGVGSANVTITVKESVQPEPKPDYASTLQGNGVAIPVLRNDTDPNGDRLTITRVGRPRSGASVLTERGVVMYTPPSDFVGTDVFNYTVSDGRNSASSSISVNVKARTLPEPSSDSATTQENVGVTIPVLRNDSDPNGDRLSIVSVTQPSRGKATIVEDAIRYVPRTGLTGRDTFSYTVTDGNQGFATATVFVTITAAPDPEPEPNTTPVAYPKTISLDEGHFTSTTILGTGVDSGVSATPSSQLTCSLASPPGSGSVNASGCSFTYLPPNGGLMQSTSFSYIVTDDGNPPLSSVPATISIIMIAGPIDVDLGSFGDVNADGAINALDVSLTQANFNRPNVTLRDGDLNRDGIVNAFDVELLTKNLGQTQTVGDTDRDGFVGFSDFLVLAANFGKQNKTVRHGDFNDDGLVGFADFLLLSGNFGKSNAADDANES